MSTEETEKTGVGTPHSSFQNEKEKDEAAEQLLMLSDFDQVTKLFRAGLQALGNNETGAIATLNQLLKKAEVLDQETREKILPMLGELSALLTTSQEELKQFNAQAQRGLEAQIREVIAKVDFSPIQKKVEAANTQIIESTNALKTKMEEIETIANRTKTLGFFASTKYLAFGFLGGMGILYGLYQHNTSQFEKKLKAEYDAKIQSLETRTAIWKNLKDDQWGATIVEINGLKHIQLVVRDNSGQINLGRSFTTPNDKGQKYPVTFVNIPIFK